jgi:hypothetical protein
MTLRSRRRGVPNSGNTAMLTSILHTKRFLAIAAQIKELRASVTPASTKTVTYHGRDIANVWHAMSDERRQWLLGRSIKIYVSKTDDGSLEFSR